MSLVPSRRALPIEPLESRVLLSVAVNAANVLWDTPEHVGGVNISSHTDWNNFVNNKDGSVNIPFQADAAAANVPLIRTNAYPDIDNTIPANNTLAFFDQKVSAVLNAGANPLLVLYTKPGLNFYNVDGTLGTGGTYATNLVWLVKHYLGQDGSGFSLQKQYYEVGNEPEAANPDYKVSGWVEYAQTFRECHDALVAAGLRQHVVLGMGIIAAPYNNGGGHAFRDNLINYTLATSPDAVNWISTHSYVGASSDQALLNSYWKLESLNSVNRNIIFSQTATATTTHIGDAAIAARMAQYNLTQSDIGIAITETNTKSDATYSTVHTIANGLWNLASSSLMLQNPLGKANNLFRFDDSSNVANSFAVYDTSATPVKDFSYWSLYILGNLTGDELVQQVTTGNLNSSNANLPYLITTATRDANYVYLQVINRKSTAISDTVSLAGVNISGTVMRYEMSNNGGVKKTADAGWVQPFTNGGSYTFPEYSATVFKIPYTVAAGMGLDVDQNYKMVAPGSTRRFTVTLQRQGGFGGTPTITVPGLPSGITAAVSSAGTDTWNVDLTTTAGLAPGAYALKVTATASGQTATRPIWLVAAPPDFSVGAAIDGALSVARGNTAIVRVSVIPTGGFNGTVNLAVSGLPAGATASVLPPIAGAGHVLLAITTSGSTPIANSTITVTGTSGVMVRQGTFTLSVTAAAAAPAAPTGLTAVHVAGQVISLAWADNASNEISYAIERSTDGVNFKELIAYNAANITRYTDVQTPAGPTYHYRVRAYGSTGVSGYSNVVSVATQQGQHIGFEASEGYSTSGGTGGGGNIVGQPSTAGVPKWAGSSIFKVEAGVGQGGGQGIRSVTSSFGAYSATSYTPAASDFQGDSGPVTSGYGGVIDFSFDLAVNSPLVNGSSAQAWDFLFGNNALEMLMMSNGTLQVQSSAGNFYAKTTPGGATNFDFDTVGQNQFVTLSSSLDYGAKTFTLFVNGVQQQTAGGATAIPFRNGGSATHFDTVRLQVRSATTSSDYVRVTVDNIAFSQSSTGGSGFAAMAFSTTSVTGSSDEELKRKRRGWAIEVQPQAPSIAITPLPGRKAGI